MKEEIQEVVEAALDLPSADIPEFLSQFLPFLDAEVLEESILKVCQVLAKQMTQSELESLFNDIETELF